MKFKFNKWEAGLFLLAVLLVLTPFKAVNFVIDKWIPLRDVKIKVIDNNESREGKGTEVWLLNIKEDSGKKVHPDITDYKFISGNWEYRDRSQFQYSSSVLLSSGDNIGSEILLKVRETPDAVLHFWMIENSGVVEITTDTGTKVYDLYSKEGNVKYIFPFENSKLVLFIKILVYILGAVILYVSVRFIWRKWDSIKWPGWMYSYSPVSSFIGTLSVVLFYNLFSYIRGIKYFNNYGDSMYYWLHNTIDGMTWETVAKTMFPPRGYIISSGTVLVARWLETKTGIDGKLIYLIYMAIITAWFIGYIIPGLYKILTKKTPQNYQIILFGLALSFFWRGHFFMPISDLMAIIFFFAALLYMGKYFEKLYKIYAFLSGIFFSVSIMSRMTYKNFLFVLVIIGLIKLIQIVIVQKKWESVKRYGIGLLLFWLGIILVALPQIQINVKQGHTGIFPYDEVGIWTLPDKTLGEVSSSQALEYLTGYPFVLADDVTNNIKKDTYLDSPYEFTYTQSLYAYINRPLSTITTIFKRIFLGMDVKRHQVYSDISYNGKVDVYFFSFWNYFVLMVSVLLFFSRKYSMSWKEKSLFVLILLVLILPQTFLHVEWRYFLPAYIISYYIFAYMFGEILFDKKKKESVEKEGKSLDIAFLISLCFLISLTLYKG